MAPGFTSEIAIGALRCRGKRDHAAARPATAVWTSDTHRVLLGSERLLAFLHALTREMIDGADLAAFLRHGRLNKRSSSVASMVSMVQACMFQAWWLGDSALGPVQTKPRSTQRLMDSVHACLEVVRAESMQRAGMLSNRLPT